MGWFRRTLKERAHAAGYALVAPCALNGLRCGHDCIVCDYLVKLAGDGHTPTLRARATEGLIVHVGVCPTKPGTAACRKANAA